MIRLRCSSVLVIGMRGLGAEVCKNLVLAGIRALTVLDPNALGPEDVAGRFLTQTEGKNVRQLKHSPQTQEYRYLGDFPPLTRCACPHTHTHTHTHSCKLAPWGLLSWNQLLLNQLLTRSSPSKSTSNEINCLTLYSMYNKKCNIEVRSDVSQKTSIQLRLHLPFWNALIIFSTCLHGGWVAPAAECSIFISTYACSFYTISGCGFPKIRFRWVCQSSRWLVVLGPLNQPD